MVVKRALDRERLELIDAISRVVQEISTEHPLVLVVENHPEADPSSPSVSRILSLHQIIDWPVTTGSEERRLPAAVMRREGALVTISWQEEVARLKPSKGLSYLARVLAAPEQELHVMTIASPGRRSNANLDQALNVFSDDSGPVLDSKAKKAYRERIRELQEELDEAESFNDPVRASKAREEMGFIADQLSGAVGLGGRDRRASSNAERARVNVTKRIKHTIEKISSEAPGLGRHLQASVKTGTYLSYSSRVEPTIAWEIDLG